MAKTVGPTDVLRRYRRWLGSQPLAERSKREYLRNVEVFCAWLGTVDDAAGAGIRSAIGWRGITPPGTSSGS